jgi:hypothetical protein
MSLTHELNLSSHHTRITSTAQQLPLLQNAVLVLTPAGVLVIQELHCSSYSCWGARLLHTLVIRTINHNNPHRSIHYTPAIPHAQLLKDALHHVVDAATL